MHVQWRFPGYWSCTSDTLLRNSVLPFNFNMHSVVKSVLYEIDVHILDIVVVVSHGALCLIKLKKT